jgi:uroporphyrinogen decarboxylase
VNSRERFTAVCSCNKLDRFPIDYSAYPLTDAKLKKLYGISTERELLDTLGCDFYYLSCRDISQNETCLPYYKGPVLMISNNQRQCPLGITFNRGAYNSKFAVDEAIKGPLADASSSSDVLSHNWPDRSWFDFSPLQEECELNSDRVIIGGLWTGILGDSYRLCGLQNFLLNMAMNSDMIQTLITKMTDMYLDLNDSVFSVLQGKLDIWFFGNDFGSQESLLFSEQMFCDFFLPGIEKLVSHAHGYGLKVMMHSCGAISQIIPHLIKAGVDIIDPVQVTANDMKSEYLARRFGGKIVFHGGIDTQQVLPNSSLEQVQKHCVDTLNTLGRTRSYIFAPSQLLQADIPVENIDVMYKTARDYKFSTKS